MPSAVDTDLAVASTPSRLYVFYQVDGGDILQSSSTDVSSWTAGDTAVATDAKTGSPIAAYYVSKDADHSGEETVHVLYVNTSGKLAEKVRVGDSASWISGNVDSSIAGKIEETSRLAAASFNGTSGWNPQGSQWAYFSTQLDARENIEEIRRTPKDPWHNETVLPEKFGDALPGTRYAASVQSGTIRLFFQDHEYNIKEYRNTNNAWTDKGVVIDKSGVQASTPLATSEDGAHIFYADKSGNVQDYNGSSTVQVVSYYPGTNLGAGTFGGKLVLFYKSLNPVGAIATRLNSGSGWTAGSTVVA